MMMIIIIIIIIIIYLYIVKMFLNICFFYPRIKKSLLLSLHVMPHWLMDTINNYYFNQFSLPLAFFLVGVCYLNFSKVKVVVCI